MLQHAIIDTANRAARGGGASLDAQVAAILAERDAVWAVPADLTSLFRTNLGSVNVAADSEDVGLMLDKSKLGAQSAADAIAGQANLGSMNAADWLAQSGGSVANSAGNLVFTTPNGDVAGGAADEVSHPAGAWLIAEFNIESVDQEWQFGSDQSQPGFTDISAGITSATGPQRFIWRASGSVSYPKIYARSNGSGAQTVTVSDWSIKAVPGNHIIQATAPARPPWKTDGTHRWLQPSGVDDWMVTSPLFDLGEQWWHVGAWRSDVSTFRRAFSWTNNSAADDSLYVNAGNTLWSAYNDSRSIVTVINGNPAVDHVIDIIRASNSEMQGFYNGVASSPINPLTPTGTTPGLALFSGRNDVFQDGFGGRFYGGIWGKGAAPSAPEFATMRAWCAAQYGGTL